MADRIDIFGDGTGVAEPEVPTFLGVEQEKLTKSQYQSQYTDFFSQYYGMEALEGLGDTGIGIDEPEDITELATPEVKEPGGDSRDMGTFESSFPGQHPSDLNFDNYGSTTYESYSGYLKGENILTDRIPLTENLIEPLFTGNFSGIDFSEAAFGEYKSAETTVKEAPAKIGEILKGNITEEQKRGLIASGVAALGGVMGGALGSVIGGETVTNAFGNPSLRPSGPLGLVADVVHSIQYNDMAQIRAAHSANQGLSQETAADFFSMGPTGFSMEFSTGFGVTRAPGSSTYTGNLMGMSIEQVRTFDALSHGFIPSGYNPAKETGTTIQEAGWKQNSMFDPQGNSLKGQVGAGGYYKQDGSYIGPTGQGSAYGTTASAAGLAAANGISTDAALKALAGVRNGTYKNLDAAIAAAQQDATNKAEADRQRAAREAAAKRAAELARSKEEAARVKAGEKVAGGSKSDPYGGGAGGRDGLSGREQASAGMSSAGGMGGNPGNKSTWAKGGQVGYAFGTPEGGVQAPSGFIDAPPSQVADGQKVADNRDMEVPEGTYILNAAAVEFAGEQDIRKMIMDAQKEAVRRGIVQDSGERASELVDIAVSSGEVTIAPHLVKIIGEDRLEKINKRGLRKTEERIAQNGQQPAGAAGGGFIEAESEVENLYTGPVPQPIGFDIVDERIRKLGPQGYGILSEKDIRLEEQSRINPATPSMSSDSERQSYRKSVEFGDTEAGFSFLGRTNYNDVLLAGLRDTRTLSDFVKTLDLNEDISGYFGLNPAGAYRENINRVIIKSPEYFATSRSGGLPLSYDAVLGHELMHKGADALAKDPNFKPNETLVQAQKAWKENEESRKGEIGGNTPEHRYIQSIINEAYMLRDVDSVLGSLEKQKRTNEPVQDFEIVYGEDGKVEFEPYFRQVNESDLANAKKKGLIKELRRSFDSYMTDENKKQFLNENKEHITEGRGGILFKDRDVPFTTVAGVFRSLNKIMAQDYAAQLFEKAIANKPIEVQRKPDRKPEPQLAPEPKYERGFLDRVLGVTPAY